VTVADTLIRLADERDAAALVVGTRGHGVIAKALLGSTAEAVIRRTSCPVVVSRAPE
jgi:nucleotide-binding universal stress UspA family protein